MAFEMTPEWLCFHPNPSTPAFKVPAGSVDAHCHVFGPGDQFPYVPERKYTPCDASKAQLFALRDRLGFARNIIVQATCHGSDNRALVDALTSSNGMARGVATVNRDVTNQQLQDLHASGVRGTRFNFVKRLVDFTPRDALMEIAHRIAPLGWTSSSISRPSTCPSCGISLPPCRRPSSSTTWDGPTSPSRSTARSSRFS